MIRAHSIRAFQQSDRGQLVSLWRTVFPDDPPRNAPDAVIESKLRVQPELLLVAEGPGGIVGAVMAGYDGFRGWIYHLAVLPEYRRQGIGTMLVQSAEEKLRRLGCPKVNLQIRSSNGQVAEFYRRIGYVVEERVSMGRPL
jgi:ribosomal protein S18 acetylase RimI-like enzyme